MKVAYVVVGGGSAGAVLAARLSERAENRVVLLEAGADHHPDATPREILEPYARHVFANPQHFWPDLQATRVDHPDAPAHMRRPWRYEQAKVIGGGSSINGQVGLRGLPADYDNWNRLGATGWDWNSVLPYFRKLESDRDFDGPLHGGDGPITIQRIPRERWDGFTRTVCEEWERLGYPYNPDMNGEPAEGYSPLPLTIGTGGRVSSAIGYLTAEVRRRPNLQILGSTRAQRLIFAGRRVTGVEYANASGVHVIEADKVVVAAGALHSPWLLQISGIGPGEHLHRQGVSVVLDRPGVGGHLLEHPSIAVSSFMPRSLRNRHPLRVNYVYLRWSSNLAGGSHGDMMMSCVTRFSWHPLGERLGTLSCYVAKSYSEGTVLLASPSPVAEPEVNFRLLSDERDRLRLAEAFRRMALIFTAGPVAELMSEPFASSFSKRARMLERQTLRNRLVTHFAGELMDFSPAIRKLLIHRVISDGPPLDLLMRSADDLERYLRGRVGVGWHPAGTCRMGAADDPLAVVDPDCKVIGVDNLYVADASVFPAIPSANINLAAVMVAERAADILKRV